MSNILRLRTVEERTGFKHSSIYQQIAEGTFPRQIKLGRRAVGWLEDEIEEWIADRIKASRAQVEPVTVARKASVSSAEILQVETSGGADSSTRRRA